MSQVRHVNAGEGGRVSSSKSYLVDLVERHCCGAALGL